MRETLGPALTLGQMLDAAAGRNPSQEAIVFKGERVSYGELKRRADAFARGLLALGLGPGDHVVVWMPNRVEWNVANLGIAKAGGVTVTCNSRYKALEVEYVLGHSDAKALILADRFDAGGIDYIEILREICPEIERPGGRLRSSRFPSLEHVIVLGDRVPAGCRPWTDIERLGSSIGAPALDGIRVGPDDAAAMLYTSGTTGEPKGCLLSHGNIYYKCCVYQDLHGWTARDRYLVPVPYFHIFGAMGGVAANCLAGSTQVVMDVFDPAEAMRLIEAERVTIFSGVPTMFITMLGHPSFGRFDLRSLRTGSIGAAPVPVEIMRRILDSDHGLGMDALVVYGLTEATGGTHWTRPGDPIDKRVATVGLRTPEIEDRIVDAVTGAPLGPGEEGEVCIAGPTLMLGYYKNPARDRREGPRRLAAHRGHGRQGLRRLRAHHGPPHGHDHRRRLQHLPGGDRELLPAPPQGAGRLHRGRARSGHGRGRDGVRHSEGGRDPHRRRYRRVRPRQDRQLQGAEVHRDRGELSADGVGEGAEIQAEGLRRGEIRPQGAGVARS
jgi:fatty-acyl-CoA synthase